MKYVEVLLWNKRLGTKVKKNSKVKLFVEKVLGHHAGIEIICCWQNENAKSIS